MSFDMENVIEALKIIKQCDDSELHIDTGELKLSVFKGNVGDGVRTFDPFAGAACQAQESASEAVSTVTAPVVDAKPERSATPVETITDEEMAGLVPVKANVTSVFYRRPSPEEAPFVEVGDKVEKDTVLCLLEVMKCFRQVTADVSGYVEKICVENSELVEAGSVMFLIRSE